MSLIESLIAVIVVSLGALSATGLQIVTKRSNRDAAQRLEATHLASALVERMRANNSPEGLSTYVSVAHYSTSTPRPVGGGTLYAAFNLNCRTQPASCCLDTTTTCTSAQTAAVELWQLEQLEDGLMEQVGSLSGAGGLDKATTCVSGPSTGTDGFYTVTIAFRGSMAIPEDTTVACGHDATDANTGERLYGASNEFRRTLTVTAYITPTVKK